MLTEVVRTLWAHYKFKRSISSAAVRRRETPHHLAIERAIDAVRSSTFDASPIEARRSALLACDDWMPSIGMRVRQRARASKNRYWGSFLYEMCRSLESRRVLEMGTCLGISASYLAATLEPGAHFVTLEGDPDTARIAQETLQGKAHIVVGPFAHTLTRAASELAPIDLVFEDGHHDETATLQYFAQLLPFLENDAVVIFDDIDWSDGMRRAWRAIQNHLAVGSVFDFGNVGVVTVHANSMSSVGLPTSEFVSQA